MEERVVFFKPIKCLDALATPRRARFRAFIPYSRYGIDTIYRRA
jgi:hypothetical protein